MYYRVTGVFKNGEKEFPYLFRGEEYLERMLSFLKIMLRDKNYKSILIEHVEDQGVAGHVESTLSISETVDQVDLEGTRSKRNG